MTKKKVFGIAVLVLILIMLCMLLGSVFAVSGTHHEAIGHSVTALNRALLSVDGGESHEVSLPLDLRGFGAHTKVKLTMTADTSAGTTLYVKTVYSPLTIRANGEMIYRYGTASTYPSFFSDPPTETAEVQLPDDKQQNLLVLEYETPAARSTLKLYAPLLGNDTSILRYLAGTMGFSFIFSILQIFLGILLIVISLLLVRFDKMGFAILWLGLFSSISGIWMLAENNLTVFILQQPSLLYILAFLGMFAMAIPLYHFAMTIMDLPYKTLLSIRYLLTFALILSMLLQLTGTLQFSQIMYFYHLMIPLCIVILCGFIAWRVVRDRDPLARQFLLPFSVLSLCGILEVLNYRVRVTNQLSSVFQLGIIFFMLMAEVVAGNFIRNSLELREKNHILKWNLNLMERQMEIQEERNNLLLANAEAVREQRHDLRHQYAVLRRFCDDQDYAALTTYLDTLVADIPTGSQSRVCENHAVDAIVSYYAGLAEKSGISVTIGLSIPPNPPHIASKDLCIIIGNLLENAIEACSLMSEQDGRRFIRLSSKIQGDLLFLTMDNSFNGKVAMRDGEYVSHKRNEIGTGLISIRSVAEKSGGKATFQTNGTVFLSSVYVRL